MQNKKIFCVNDIHGHYKELMYQLNKYGYDSNNDNHLLIALGDIFDRGRESLEVYQFLKPLTDAGKAIVIKGNHDPMFITFLEQSGIDSMFNAYKNGMMETIDSFDGRESSFAMWCVINKGLKFEEIDPYKYYGEWADETAASINAEYPELLNWLNNLPWYYETANCIFTHGAIDGTCPDWHHPHKDIHGRFMDWEACAWDDGSFFNSPIVNTDKTVVIGHYYTGYLRKMHKVDTCLENDHRVLVRDDGRVIALDVPGDINVLVIEEEELLNVE